LPDTRKQKKWYDATYSHGMSTDEMDDFLRAPDSTWLLKLAVVKQDGWPAVTPMWYQWDGNAFYVVGRKRSAWVQDLIREPRCAACVDEEAMPPDGALRKVLAQCTAEVVEGPVRAEGSQWLAVADEMARRYAGPAGGEGLKTSYGWERYLVRLTPREGGVRTWQGVGWARRYLDPDQLAELDNMMTTAAPRPATDANNGTEQP
jgi:nitroimidazol reductase NimA-like FMN-containing flavoprotein (pyridoxamine 5'-phosphate oxidase superfamily)